MTTTDTSHEARCLRCGRKLSAAKSVAASFGPGCLAAIRREAREHALDGLTAKQAAEATEIVADGGVVPSAHKGVWLAASGDGSQVYRATPGGQCNCKWGMRTLPGKPCKHVGAVRLVQLTTRRQPAKAA
jgi:hypothetical protein